MQTSLEHQITAAELRAGDKLLVAVSGGVDSVVLLNLLHTCAGPLKLRLHVAHLDHQIRTDSSADADFVRHLCDELGVPCLIAVCDVPALAAVERLSLEMAGRQARREFLQREASRVGARLIVLAHHRDDQVETFMLRLLRGSGVTGLSAMQPLHGRWWRPLLECSREQILDYAQEQQLEWVEDLSNSDPAYLRNRLRHQLLPQMREINPRYDGRLSELCRQLQADEIYWQQQVAVVLPRLIVAETDGLRLDRSLLLELPEALRGRVLREALRRIRGDLQRLEAVHLRAVDDLLSSERSQTQLNLPACWVARRYETLWLRRESAVGLPSYDLEVPIPGDLQLPCGRTLRVKLEDEPQGEALTVAEFALDEIATPLRVRNWQPGDRFAPQGMEGHKLLKRLFGDVKVELEERQRTPLLVSGETILWVAGMRRSCHAPAVANTSKILRFELVCSA